MPPFLKEALVEQMIAELGREDVYIAIFLVVAILAGIIFMTVFIRGIARRDREQLNREQQQSLSPYSPPEGFLPGAPGQPPAAQPREKELVGDLHVGDDVPDDVFARGGPAEKGEAGPVHSVEQIQKPQLKSLESALTNTRSSFIGRIKNLFGSKPTLSGSELEDLEEILYTSDLGPTTVQRLLAAVETRVKVDGGSGFEAVRSALRAEMLEIFSAVAPTTTSTPPVPAPLVPETEAMINAGTEYLDTLGALSIWKETPSVVMVVGVNGAGKTTTIGKLARRIAQSGRKVMVAAGDTFRAAAGDQLRVWTDRAQVEIYSPPNVTDPSAVAYQACEEATRRGFDVVIIDTAGRLHTQKNLMEELKKMKRVLTKIIPLAPHEVLLVLDANSGQNAMVQAREFTSAIQVTGVVLTKLDGSAKGGVAVGLAAELGLPIKLIGVGEGIEDLRRFSSQEFVESIL